LIVAKVTKKRHEKIFCHGFLAIHQLCQKSLADIKKKVLPQLTI
jgi:hypothetical protein